MTKLDYTLKTPEERKALVEKILEENPTPSIGFLNLMGDYLALCLTKEEKKEKKILTENRLFTINKHETSYEGLITKFENGEDGVYGIVNTNGNLALQKKQKISAKDIEEHPELKQTLEAIESWKKIADKAEGKDKFLATKALIDFRKEQYSIKSGRRYGHQYANVNNTPVPSLTGKEWIDSDGNVQYSGVSLCNPAVCSAILCNYDTLISDPGSELYELLQSFDHMREIALADSPLLNEIVKYKIMGLPNVEIQQKLLEKFGTTHSLEYISSLWRKKIPNLIASAAEDEFLMWYYTYQERGQ